MTKKTVAQHNNEAQPPNPELSFADTFAQVRAEIAQAEEDALREWSQASENTAQPLPSHTPASTPKARPSSTTGVAGGKLRLVFGGMDGRLSTTPLQMLASRHEIVGVVHSEPRRRKEGRLLRYARAGKSDGNLRSFANYLHCQYFEAGDIYSPEFVSLIKYLKPDLLVLSNFSIILPPEIFEFPRYGTINLHLGALPQYRGANPILWMFYNGERRGHAVVHEVDAGEDTGPILGSVDVPLPANTTGSQYLDDILPAASSLLLRIVDGIAAHGIQPAPPQPPADVVQEHASPSAPVDVVQEHASPQPPVDVVQEHVSHQPVVEGEANAPATKPSLVATVPADDTAAVPADDTAVGPADDTAVGPATDTVADSAADTATDIAASPSDSASERAAQEAEGVAAQNVAAQETDGVAAQNVATQKADCVVAQNVAAQEAEGVVAQNVAAHEAEGMVAQNVAAQEAEVVFAVPQCVEGELRRARFVASGEPLLDWDTWGCEQVGSFLRGASIWYEPWAPIPGFYREYLPGVVGESRGKPGSLHMRGLRGWVSCRDGLVPIRLRVSWYELMRLLAPVVLVVFLYGLIYL